MINQRFLLGKSQDQELCEDIIVEGEYFLAVIDGVISTSTHFVLRKYKDKGVVFGNDTEYADDERGNLN